MFLLSRLRRRTGRALRQGSARTLLAVERLEPRLALSASPVLLDFGTAKSPVQPGYTGVPLVGYTAARGHGWDGLTGLRAKDAGGANALTRDLHFGFGSAGIDKTFLVDLPPGTYEVTALLGDATHKQEAIDVWAEGQKVGSRLATFSGQFLRHTFRVDVLDGQLNLRLVDTGGATRYFALNGLEIVDVRPTTLIDAAWLAQRGPGPYVLDQPGMTYVLQTDVRTEGTAFVVGAADVTLDLNGHTVTYGDSAPVTVVNGGFEEGSNRSVPGWDLSAAPAAALTANTRHLFGDQVLRLSNFSTPQRIVSDVITLPVPGHTYAATITPANPDAHSSVRLSVIDAATGQTVASGTSSDASRGFSAVAHFTPPATAVRLQIDVTPPAGVTDSLDLDQATLTVSGDYGVVASRAWGGDILGFANLSAEARAAYSRAANFTVKGGSLVQGQGDGYGSSPLFFRSLPGVVVDGVTTHATGTDTLTMEATHAKVGVTVRNSTFREEIDNVTNRMMVFATLKLNNITGPIVVEGNRLIGSSQVGIMLAMNDPAYTVNLRDNEIRQNAVVTNGYAILLSAVQNFTIAGNTIQPTSGKGIDLDGYNGNLLGHGEVHDNHVDVRERVNREYPTGLEAVALRIRNNVDDMGPHRDIRVHDNVFIARTGPGLVSQAYGARISYANVGGAMNDAGIALEDNTIVAVVETTNTSFRAKALVLDRIDAGIGLRIRGNVLESNDISLALTDTGGSVHQVDLVSTTLRRSAEGAARPYTAVLAGYYNRQIADVRLLDTRLENGATDAIVWAGTGVKDLSVGWLLTVTAQDPVGAALPSAAVSVSDKSGVEVFSGTTGADGSVRDIPVVTTVFRQETTNPRIITTDHRGPHRVEASHGGGSAISTVDLDSSMVLILTVE